MKIEAKKRIILIPMVAAAMISFSALKASSENVDLAIKKDLKSASAKYEGVKMGDATQKIMVKAASKEDEEAIDKINKGKIVEAKITIIVDIPKPTIDKALASQFVESKLQKEVSIANIEGIDTKRKFGISQHTVTAALVRGEKKELDSISKDMAKFEEMTPEELAGIIKYDLDYLVTRVKELNKVKNSDEVKALTDKLSGLKKKYEEAVVAKEKRTKEQEIKKKEEKEQERIAKETENKKKEEAKAFEVEKRRYQELKEKSENAKVKEEEKVKKEAEKKIEMEKEAAEKKVKAEEKAKKETEKVEVEKIKATIKETERKKQVAEFEAAQKEAVRVELEGKTKAVEEEAEKERKFKTDVAQKDKEWKEMVQKEKEEKTKKPEEKAAAAAEKPRLNAMISKTEPMAASKPGAPALKATVKPVSEAVKALHSTDLNYVASMITEAISTKETSLSEPGSKSEMSKTFESIKKAFGTEGNVIESDRIRILLEKWDEEGKRYAIKFVPKVTMK